MYNFGVDVNENKNVIGLISILIPIVTTVLIINFLLDIVTLEKIEGLPLFLPFIVGPIENLEKMFFLRRKDVIKSE